MFKRKTPANKQIYGEHWFAEWRYCDLPEAWSFYSKHLLADSNGDPRFTRVSFDTDTEESARAILAILDAGGAWTAERANGLATGGKP